MAKRQKPPEGTPAPTTPKARRRASAPASRGPRPMPWEAGPHQQARSEALRTTRKPRD